MPIGGSRISIVDTPQGRFAELAKGANIHTSLGESLSSATARVGQTFPVTVTKDVTADSVVVIPAGATIYGSIKKITPPKFKVMKAKLALQFDRININGRSYDFPGKTGLDVNAYAKKGASQLGEAGAKKALKYFIPALGPALMAADAAKTAKGLSESKEITMPRGSTIIVSLTRPVRLPVN